MTPRAPLDAVFRHQRWLVCLSLGVIVALSWGYLVAAAAAMEAMGTGGWATTLMWLMPMGQWTVAEAALVFLMWVVMMVGMMVPSAAPMILLYARVRRSEAGAGQATGPTAVFTLGYLLAWTLFSLVATALQWGLTELRLLDDRMTSVSPLLAGGLLVLAGVYQLTPLKLACLAHCRSPIGFLLTHWRAGDSGALRMGAEHGFWCVGCCWALMVILFAVGVMNIAWIAGLCGLVLLEKTVPQAHWLGRTAGLGLIALGIATIGLPRPV
jgi:predicted metal-binding membrane protein